MSVHMTSNIIFLDFDGPMIPARAWIINVGGRGIYETFDPIAVRVVDKILQYSNTSLVISSSWRSNFENRVQMHEFLMSQNFKTSGYNLLHEDWRTIRFGGMKERGDEIREWLGRHPEVKNYAVLDDYPVDIENLIQVDYQDGLSYDDQLRLFRHFKLDMGDIK